MELPPDETRPDKTQSKTERKLDLLFLLLLDQRVWNLIRYPEADGVYKVLRDLFKRLGFDFAIDSDVTEAFELLSEVGDRELLSHRIWRALDDLQTQYGQLQTSFEGIAHLKERLVAFEENQGSFLAHQQEQTKFTLKISNSILEITSNNVEMANNYSKMADNYSRLTTEQANLSKLVNEMKASLDTVVTDYAIRKDK